MLPGRGYLSSIFFSKKYPSRLQLEAGVTLKPFMTYGEYSMTGFHGVETICSKLDDMQLLVEKRRFQGDEDFLFCFH